MVMADDGDNLIEENYGFKNSHALMWMGLNYLALLSCQSTGFEQYPFIYCYLAHIMQKSRVL